MVGCLIYHATDHEAGYAEYGDILEKNGFTYEREIHLKAAGLKIGIYDYSGSIDEAVRFGEENCLVIEENLERVISFSG